MKTVSVIVPCRNEARYLPHFLDSLLAQDLGPEVDCEILIADGMSDDGSREILAEWHPRFKSLTILDNPQRFVSNGLNAAIRLARGEVIVRMDVHSDYAPDYIRQCMFALEQSGADNVGGPAVASGRTYVERAACLAHQSPFGCGGARFHNPSYEGYADTVMFGCWRKATLERLGGFDEEFIRNQDDELNLRITRGGGKIWQTPKIRLLYHPRSSIRALARQYAQYGYWKTYVLRKHKIPASWRHLVPGTFVAALVIAGVSAPFSVFGRYLLAGLVSSYALANITASILACRNLKDLVLLPILPLVFAAYQLSYGLGFLRGLFDIAVRNRPNPSFSALVR